MLKDEEYEDSKIWVGDGVESKIIHKGFNSSKLSVLSQSLLETWPEVCLSVSTVLQNTLSCSQDSNNIWE